MHSAYHTIEVCYQETIITATVDWLYAKITYGTKLAVYIKRSWQGVFGWRFSRLQINMKFLVLESTVNLVKIFRRQSFR